MKPVFFCFGFLVLCGSQTLMGCAAGNREIRSDLMLPDDFSGGEYLLSIKNLLESRALNDPQKMQMALNIKIEKILEVSDNWVRASFTTPYPRISSGYLEGYNVNFSIPKSIWKNTANTAVSFLHLKLPEGFCFNEKDILNAFKGREWVVSSDWHAPPADINRPSTRVVTATSVANASIASFLMTPSQPISCAEAVFLRQSLPGTVVLP